MRSGGPGRATPVAVLSRLAHRRTALIILAIAVACLVLPAQVFAYTENMFELAVASNPPVIVQNQSYSTSTRQTLFHTATNALADTEAFAFSGFPESGIDLAQTSSITGAGTETGYYMSTASSDLVPPVHIGNGYLGTWIGDPLGTGAPIFAGLTFPQMTKTDVSALASQPAGLAPAGSATKPTNNTTGARTEKDIATFRPVVRNELDSTLENASALDATAAAKGAKVASAAANASKANVSATANATKKQTAPSLAIKPGEPFYHQQNKPFSTALTSSSGPFKATQRSTANTTGFDRFLRNTVGRSTTDKAFNGTTSSPTYITPDKALAVQIPYDFIQGARGMTMPGTRLNYRAWPL